MERKKIKRQLCCLLLSVSALFSFYGCGTKMTMNISGKQLTVVTTLFPYYDFARAVAGNLLDTEISVEMILPPGQESHSFEPTASDLITMQEADVLIYNGGAAEQWVDRVLESNEGKNLICMVGMEAVDLYEEETTGSMKQTLLGGLFGHGHAGCTLDHEHGHEGHVHEHENLEVSYEIEYDEHIWTSPVNAAALVRAVCDTMCEAAPQYEQIFRKNAEAYAAEIEKIDAKIRDIVNDADSNLLVFADRFPFLYFVKEYGLCYDAAFAGCSHDTEPSAATLAELIDLVNEDSIPVIYCVEQSSRKTAKIIQESTKAEICEFHSCHNVTKEQLDAGITYVDLMKTNIGVLEKGLE